MANLTDSNTMPSSATSPASVVRFQWLNWSGFFLAFIQSVCSAFIALHGVRFLLGIGAVVLASTAWGLAECLHVAAIRVPMMFLALIGAVVNLFALWQVRRIRRRSALAWRQQPLTPGKRRSEVPQFALSILTLLLLFAEWISHFKLFGTI